MKKFLNIAGVISGIAGGSILLLFFLVLHIGLLISAITGVAGYIGTYLVIYAFKPKSEISFNMTSGVTTEEINRILKDGDEKVRQLQFYAGQVRNLSIKQKLGQITNIVKDIFDNFRKAPKDVKYAKQFLGYYLDTTIKIVKKYTELSSQNVHTPEIQATLTKAENMLDSIEKAFEIQMARLLKDDVMDLDVEIETLEKTFIAEDLK